MNYGALVWELWMEWFQTFFGTPPDFLVRRMHLRQVCVGVFSGTEENGTTVYSFAITGNGNAWQILNVLTRNLNEFFYERKLRLNAQDESILFQWKGVNEVVASLDLLKEGWKFRVPPKSFSGPSYLKRQQEWDDVAVQIQKTLTAHFS